MKLVAKLENEIEIREVPTELFLLIICKRCRTIFDDTSTFFALKIIIRQKMKIKSLHLRKIWDSNPAESRRFQR